MPYETSQCTSRKCFGIHGSYIRFFSEHWTTIRGRILCYITQRCCFGLSHDWGSCIQAFLVPNLPLRRFDLYLQQVSALQVGFRHSSKQDRRKMYKMWNLQTGLPTTSHRGIRRKRRRCHFSRMHFVFQMRRDVSLRELSGDTRCRQANLQIEKLAGRTEMRMKSYGN